ncbi:MAG: TerB family tellurite resistance protein [Phycisphaerales bacterium]|nr:MAG: TerB family tellurite resistance protein [Phycisphaerales bacterium]
MGTVLIVLSILLIACVVAAFGGLIDRRVLAELANSCGRMASICLSAFTRLTQSMMWKNSVEKFRRSGSFVDFVSNISRGVGGESNLDLCAPLNMNILNCRVQMTELKEGDVAHDAFEVEICGSIHAPNDTCSATLNISILDVSDDSRAEPVLDGNPQVNSRDWTDSPQFKYVAELGRLPRRVTKLEDWTAVARLRTDGPVFPRRGRRTLQFKTSIRSADGGRELAEAYCNFVYDNALPGYLDLRENEERTRVLTVALAFAVSAVDNRLYDCEVELIKRWARQNVLDDAEPGSDQSRAKLEKALSKTVAFFTEGNKLDIFGLCEEIVEIAPVGKRYEILDLCLHVAKAKGSVTAEEMAMLRSLADMLEVDAAKFRAMVDKILPVEIHEVMDIDEILGITSDMSSEKTRRHLNKEYSKWNSRVTSANPDVQSKADQMLKLIAEARGRYVADGSNCGVSSAVP